MADREAQADVVLDALVMIDGALGAYAAGAAQALPAIRADFDRRLSALHDLENDASHELDRLQTAYDGADDDIETSLQELNEATDRLTEIRRWIADVDLHHTWLDLRAAACEEIVHRSVPSARAFLREKIDQLQHYHAVQLEVVLPADSRPATLRAPSMPVPTKAAGVVSPRRLQDHPLPAGFRWVSLSEIDLTKQLDGVGDAEDFRKVSYDAMCQGFARLRDEILPAMAHDSQRGSDYFRDIDQQNGLEYCEGLQLIYEAFFGQHDFIYFVRRPDGTIDLINGRHRVKIAKDLGWDAVPAQVRE